MTRSPTTEPAATAAHADVLRFGPFELDPLRQELKKSGHVRHLPHQPFRILFLLASRAGEVITREEIQHEIWGAETFVDFEQGINAVIRQIRIALGDNAEAPRYVETLPRMGYCFIAPVEKIAPSSQKPANSIAMALSIAPASGIPRKRWLIAGIAAISAVIAIIIAVQMLRRPLEHAAPSASPRGTVIAVLPFRVIGVLPQTIDERSFSEELRAVLDRLLARRIRVLDARAVSTANQSLAELTRRTGATLVIAGVIQRAPSGLQVIVTGIDPASQSQLWTETYERPANRVEGMAIEVAHFVTRSVAQRYLPPPRHEARLLTKVSPRALALYRQARMERDRPRPHLDFSRAITLFEQAVREQPQFPEALSGLADLWAEQTLRAMTAAGRSDAARRGAEFARHALTMQPANAEAHDALGLLAFQHDYDYRKAEDEFRLAVAGDPDYPDGHVNFSLVLAAMGQSDQALAEWSIGQQLDPVTLDLSPLLALIYLHSRRYEDALASYREILAVRPDSVHGNWGMLSVFIIQNRWAEAIALTRHIAQQPPLPADATADEAAFRREYKRLESYMRNNIARGIFNDYSQAVYYAELGERDRSFAMLQWAIDQRLPSVSWMLVDPRLDPLRRDPRWLVLIQRARLIR